MSARDPVSALGAQVIQKLATLYTTTAMCIESGLAFKQDNLHLQQGAAPGVSKEQYGGGGAGQNSNGPPQQRDQVSFLNHHLCLLLTQGISLTECYLGLPRRKARRSRAKWWRWSRWSRR